MPNMTLFDCNLISFFKDEFDRIISLPEKKDTLTQCETEDHNPLSHKDTLSNLLIMGF
jgi:hypothetical protein